MRQLSQDAETEHRAQAKGRGHREHTCNEARDRPEEVTAGLSGCHRGTAETTPTLRTLRESRNAKPATASTRAAMKRPAPILIVGAIGTARHAGPLLGPGCPPSVPCDR